MAASKAVSAWRQNPAVLPLIAAVAGGLSLAGYTLSHRLSSDPDIAVNKAERESGEIPADREERAQEYHDSALFAKKMMKNSPASKTDLANDQRTSHQTGTTIGN